MMPHIESGCEGGVCFSENFDRGQTSLVAQHITTIEHVHDRFSPSDRSLEDDRPTKRQRTATRPSREVGLMRSIAGDKFSGFVGSASGIFFIRSVYGAMKHSQATSSTSCRVKTIWCVLTLLKSYGATMRLLPSQRQTFPLEILSLVLRVISLTGTLPTLSFMLRLY
jgi:hypothetical protein